MSDGYDVDARTVEAYNLGVYEITYVGLRQLIEDQPDALGDCFSVLYTCERVLGTMPIESDLPYLNRWVPTPGSLRGRLRLRLGSPTSPVRCKWCGHYTKWVDPKEDSLFDCGCCRAVYPMPSWGWDLPYLMAHSEGRGSWAKGSLPSRLWNEMCDRYERESGVKMT